MDRRRLAKSLRSLGTSYLHHLSIPFPRPRVNGKNGSFSGHDVPFWSSRQFVQWSVLARNDGRQSEVFTLLGKRPRFTPARRPMSQGLGMPTMAASIDQSDCQRVARSHSSMISTSGRTSVCCYEQRRGHTSGQNFEGKEKISVTFVDKDGEETKIQVPVGMSMLEAAHENDIELEGACEGSLACSTCHVIIMDDDMYAKLPEPSDEENDMLDLAFGLTETSRLGCQVLAEPELDGLQLALPAATRNFAVDGHVPKPH